jgi:hypothetical protein
MTTLHHTTLDDIQKIDIKRNRPARAACSTADFHVYLTLKSSLDKSYHQDLQMAFLVLGDNAMMSHFKQFLIDA